MKINIAYAKYIQNKNIKKIQNNYDKADTNEKGL